MCPRFVYELVFDAALLAMCISCPPPNIGPWEEQLQMEYLLR